MNSQQIKEAREQIQNDLLCLLEGMPQEVQDRACQIVVDNLNPLLEQAN